MPPLALGLPLGRLARLASVCQSEDPSSSMPVRVKIALLRDYHEDGGEKVRCTVHMYSLASRRSS